MWRKQNVILVGENGLQWKSIPTLKQKNKSNAQWLKFSISAKSPKTHDDWFFSSLPVKSFCQIIWWGNFQLDLSWQQFLPFAVCDVAEFEFWFVSSILDNLQLCWQYPVTYSSSSSRDSNPVLSDNEIQTVAWISLEISYRRIIISVSLKIIFSFSRPVNC